MATPEEQLNRRIRQNDAANAVLRHVNTPEARAEIRFNESDTRNAEKMKEILQELK
jgi:transposase